jgi:phosphate-selective porin OprO/OprP
MSLLLATTAGLRLEVSASAKDTNSPPASSENLKSSREEFADKFQVRILTNTPAETAHATNQPGREPNAVHWDFSWQGWDGLHVGVSTKTQLKTPPGLEPINTNLFGMHLEQLKMGMKIGALFEVDGAVYKTTGSVDANDDIQLRRARLIAQGDCILVFPVSYDFEVGYVPHKFNLHQAWLSSQQIDYIGYIVVGVFGPPMGLDMVTSSRDLTFMQPATGLQALAPANEAGIQIGHPVFDQRGTWALGIFGGGVIATEYGNASQHYGNLIGRMTYLAQDHLAPEPAENRYLHLGLSANFQYSASSTVRYESRPESYLADKIIDTGNIDADASGALGAEAAYVNGPFCVQGEFIDSLVRQNNGEGLNFYGFYGCASWYLTGESRPYDRVNGCFKRLVPLRNFDFGRGGAWGAFEAAVRFSYTDLTDGDVQGGRIHLLMGELNWYLHSHVRWMFNAGSGHVTGGRSDGNILLFQTRVGVDF